MPIDELGDGAVRVGGGARANKHPWAGHTGIHDNSESGNHPKSLAPLVLKRAKGQRAEVTWDLCTTQILSKHLSPAQSEKE